MAGRNEEVVRRYFALMSASPEEVRRSIAEFWDSDADYYPVRKFPDSQPCHGLNEISRFFGRFMESWLRYENAVKKVIEVDDQRVFAHITLHAEGRESGVNLEGDLYHCLWFRHGRFLRVEDHLTLKGALHGLGLQGETLEAAGLLNPSNLELVRAIHTAWERGDFSSAEWAHPEIDYAWGNGPQAGSWTGLVDMSRVWADFLSAWEEYRVEASEFRELDDEQVLVLFHPFGRARASGLELEHVPGVGASLFTVQDGKVTKLALYWPPLSEADLAELGIASETRSPLS